MVSPVITEFQFSKARLKHCNKRLDGQCPSWIEEETDCTHLFIKCQRSLSYWSFMNYDLTTLMSCDSINSLLILNPLQEQNSRIKSTVLIYILWNI